MGYTESLIPCDHCYWLWFATQNVEDFPDAAEKLLNMIEFWVCLVMPPDEVQKIKRFKSLSPAQEELLLSASKISKKYTEGVVLASAVEALFRVVQPSLYLVFHNKDAVSAQKQAERQGGNGGRSWIGGRKRGGSGQAPISVVQDTTKAGYNLLYGRTDTTSDEAVSGGGKGWGSAGTSGGNWVGGGGIAGGRHGSGSGAGGSSGGGHSGSSGSGNECQGGMCTVWGTPHEAAEWTKKVMGDTELRSCDGCEKSQTIAGTGLIRELEEKQGKIHDTLVGMLRGGEITQAKLDDVSAGNDLVVSRQVIESMRTDPQGPLLAQRLSSEMALARTLTKAMWARRTLIAGSSDPGIENNPEGTLALDRKVEAFNRDIELLQSEMEIRKSLASSAAMSVLQRASNRADGSVQNEYSAPRSRLDDRGGPVESRQQGAKP